MLTRSGMKAKYERYYSNGIMHLANGEPEIAIKYFENAAMQLKDYIKGLCDEEYEEKRDSLIELVAHVKELEKHVKERKIHSDTVKVEGDSSFAYSKSEISDVSFSDVVGLENVKAQIYDKVIYPKRYTELYERFKKRLGGGILLYGPPGNGKTMIAKAIARETGATFFPIKFSDLGSKWFGETEGKIKALFDEARKEENAVIFFDEIDSIASSRGDNATTNRMVADLLTQLDGINRVGGNIIVLAATNRLDVLDEAILRPGRFDEKIYVPLPDMEARRAMFEMKLSSVPSSLSDFDELAKLSEGFSAAEIDLACERAKQTVIRAIIAGGPNDAVISRSDVVDAIDSVRAA